MRRAQFGPRSYARVAGNSGNGVNADGGPTDQQQLLSSARDTAEDFRNRARVEGEDLRKKAVGQKALFQLRLDLEGRRNW